MQNVVAGDYELAEIATDRGWVTTDEDTFG